MIESSFDEKMIYPMRYAYSLQTIDSVFTSLYFSPSLMGEKREVKMEKFKEGDVFSLQGMECDDFTMPVKEYEVVRKVDEVFGVKLDGLVVKQISGENSTVFSLTKTDCQTLGINFQPRLLFFPMNMDWKEVRIKNKEQIKEFNPNDFSSYPVLKETKLIEKIVVCVSEIHNYNETLYKIGDIFDVKIANIIGGISLKVKRPIPTKMGVLNPSRILHGKNITGCLVNNRSLFLYDSKVYIEFNVLGINPKDVEGMRFEDLFDVVVMGRSINDLRENLELKTTENKIFDKRRYLVNLSEKRNEKTNNKRWRNYAEDDWEEFFDWIREYV